MLKEVTSTIIGCFQGRRLLSTKTKYSMVTIKMMRRGKGDTLITMRSLIKISKY